MKKIKAFLEAIICAGARGSLREAFICKSINLLSVVIILFSLTAGTVFFLLTGRLAVLWGCLAEAVLIGLVIVLNKQRLHHAAGLLCFTALNAATFYFAAILGKEVNAQIMIIFLVGLAITILVALLFYIYADINGQLLDKLEGNNEQLEQHLLKAFNASEVKKNFIREMVHEIKSGFNPIEGMVRYLSEEDRLQKTAVTPDQLIAHIKGGCFNYRQLLANLLEFSKIEYGKKDDPIIEPLEIRSFMEQVVGEFQYSARADNTYISLQVAEEVPSLVHCDPIKLRQIANNLIHNAIKFVRVGCSILVKVELRGLDSWLLAIINEGDQIPEERLQRIFEPYQHVRTGINMDGNGLGLFITHRLVGSLRGNMEVLQADKEFTVFEITFPLEKKMAHYNGTLEVA